MHICKSVYLKKFSFVELQPFCRKKKGLRNFFICGRHIKPKKKWWRTCTQSISGRSEISSSLQESATKIIKERCSSTHNMKECRALYLLLFFTLFTTTAYFKIHDKYARRPMCLCLTRVFPGVKIKLKAPHHNNIRISGRDCKWEITGDSRLFK